LDLARDIVDAQTIRIQNRTKGKMTCVWINNNDESVDSTFTVSPMTADIPPKSIFEFKVYFRPTIDNEFYGKVLECYCYFKSMRTFRLVNEDTFTPPWCLTPKLGGNTFPTDHATFIPKIDWGKCKLTFSSCFVDRSQYEVLKITNAGDTTVKFSFLDLGISSQNGKMITGDLASRIGSAFSVKPRIGVLRKGETRMVMLRFCPFEKRLYEEVMTCYFNNSPLSTYKLNLRAYGSIPDVIFGTDNTVRFKPTCVGSMASRVFQIQNISKVALDFEWQIPKHFSKMVRICPTFGHLEPNGTMELNCTFSPKTANYYTLKVPCYFAHGAVDEIKSRSSLVITGEGIYGEINASGNDNITLDHLLINTVSEKDFTIFNPSACDIHFKLLAKKKTTADDCQPKSICLIDSLRDSEIQIVQPNSVLPARSSQSIKVKIALKKECEYEFEILYHLIEDSNESNESIAEEVELHKLITIRAKGVHPLISIRDIRSEGVSKTILWQMFSLDRFNELLSQEPSNPEAFIEETAPENYFPIDSQPVDLEMLAADVNFDFGATLVGSKPTLLKLSLKNSGVVPVDWGFSFPNDFDIEIERWADPGDLTEEQSKRNFILDHNIFYVSPKRGHLDPGDVVHLLMTYSHEFAGPHRLPALFRLRNGNSKVGKEILINFIGYSVPPTQKFLHLQSINHQLAPIVIGTQSPPIQYYRLMNRCSSPLNYKIDTSSIEKLNADNMNFEILKLNKSENCILPGEMDYIEFVFNPLESKEYELDLPIIVDSGKKRMITIRGRGIPNTIDWEEKNLMDPRVIGESIPNVPTLPPLENPIASISLERIDFGHIPVQSLMRQVITVTNVTQDKEVSVNWAIPSVWPNESLKISPTSCFLKAGESQVFKIVFEPDELPRLYNFDLVCNIVNKSELVRVM
jgi:cilia- and flagella-associated protein 65